MMFIYCVNNMFWRSVGLFVLVTNYWYLFSSRYQCIVVFTQHIFITKIGDIFDERLLKPDFIIVPYTVWLLCCWANMKDIV